jgi:hypothetical protein
MTMKELKLMMSDEEVEENQEVGVVASFEIKELGLDPLGA